MLQIISGKFFTSDERNTGDEKAVYFSNFTWISPIKTCVGNLEGVDKYTLVNSFVFSFINQLEKTPPKAGVLFLADAEEAKEQFRLLAMFGLKAFFARNQQDYVYQCRREPMTNGDAFVPTAFVTGYCDKQVMGTVASVDNFEKLIQKIIDLPRAKYKSLIRCLQSVENALVVLNYNIDLAYALIVFALESLAVEHGSFTPSWDDYHEDVKRKLEPIEMEIESSKVEKIRRAILESAHVKSKFQFIQFVLDHVSDDYFVRETANVQGPIRKSQLRKSLVNAYQFRSSFAHVLEPILDQLKVPTIARSDAFIWDNSPYLSFRGLVRLTNHVIGQFIDRGERLEKENFDWRSDLPGVIKMRIAPEYWIWQHEGFQPHNSSEHLSGFLQHFQEVLMGSRNAITALDKLFEVFEKQFEHADENDRRRMLIEYVLYNQVIKPELQRLEWKSIAEKNSALLDKCTIETIAYIVITGQKFPWNSTDIVSVFEQYLVSRYRKSNLNLPPLLEIRIFLEIGNSFLRSGSIDLFDNWFKRALFEAAGLSEIQSLIETHRTTKTEMDQSKIWNLNAFKLN